MNRSPYLITDRKIKFAILGCGRISQQHIKSIEQHKQNAELVAVCDTDESVLNNAAEKSNVKVFCHLRRCWQKVILMWRQSVPRVVCILNSPS